MLGYYFGFLDGDGSGRALHEYYRNVLIRTGKVQATPEPGMEGATAEAMVEKIFGGRSDQSISAEMMEKFAKVGVRFKK